MSLPFQSRFLYRRRKNTPVPSKSTFAGFGGPQYTLGSLSNRSGVDWALPRYIRNEPVMFMAGYGDILDEILAKGGVSKEEESSWGQESSWLEDAAKTIQSWGQDAQNFYKENKSTIDTLIKTGMTAKQAYDMLTGSSQQSLPPALPPVNPPTKDIPPASLPPTMMTTGKLAISPTVLKQVIAKRLEEQKAAKTNTMLLLGAAAVGAYLLLRK